MSARSVFSGLREIDGFFVRNCGTTSYRELLAAMRTDPLYVRTQYIALQKKAARMWHAEKKYRAQQRAARAHVDPVVWARRMGCPCIPSEPWPAAHAWCSLQ